MSATKDEKRLLTRAAGEGRQTAPAEGGAATRGVLELTARRDS